MGKISLSRKRRGINFRCLCRLTSLQLHNVGGCHVCSSLEHIFRPPQLNVRMFIELFLSYFSLLVKKYDQKCTINKLMKSYFNYNSSKYLIRVDIVKY
jgi:hypothetical protein